MVYLHEGDCYFRRGRTVPTKGSEEIKRKGFNTVTEVSAPVEKVKLGLKRFKERIERNRRVEGPRYSAPSEKTRFRVLEL